MVLLIVIRYERLTMEHRPNRGDILTIDSREDKLNGLQVEANGCVVDEANNVIMVTIRIHKALTGPRGDYFTSPIYCPLNNNYYVGVRASFTHEKGYFMYPLHELIPNEEGYSGLNQRKIKKYTDTLK